MSEYIGSRISLISKRDIRYVGVLYQINSEDSTVSLENVKSYGTEGRKGRPEEEIAPSDQVYEYIVFRGSDVKDLRIEEQPVKENKPPAVPNDPAILGARPRPDNQPQPSAAAGPSGPPAGSGAPGPAGPGPAYGAPGFNNFYAGPPPPWGRGAGPVPPGPGYGGMPYPPPPGWFPPGPGFPQGPGAPGPWNPGYQYPPGPPPPGQPPAQDQQPRVGSQEPKRSPIGAGADKEKRPTPPQTRASAGSGHASQPEARPSSNAPQSAPSATVNPTSEAPLATAPKIPTGPKNTKVPVAIPIPPAPRPFQLLTNDTPAKQPAAAATPPVASVVAPAAQDATPAARAAVANAMAQLDSAQRPQASNGTTMDNLTKKVNEMRVMAARSGHSPRGRGRGPRGGASRVEVPDTPFDFATANAKFNKEELVKEASSSTPVGDAPNAAPSSSAEPAIKSAPEAYNKTKSFFDNISSEAKDRADNNGQKPGGREWRGEEQKKNIETFGQGSVDGGYRGGYRGRGRGRGNMRGRGYGGGRGRGRGPHDPNQADSTPPAAPQA